jgi:hypothetical protein
MDLDPQQWHNSALHHVYELLSIKGSLAPGSLVAVDDNLITEDGNSVGNGFFVAQWMQAARKKMIYQGYQFIWEW